MAILFGYEQVLFMAK